MGCAVGRGTVGEKKSQGKFDQVAPVEGGKEPAKEFKKKKKKRKKKQTVKRTSRAKSKRGSDNHGELEFPTEFKYDLEIDSQKFLSNEKVRRIDCWMGMGRDPLVALADPNASLNPQSAKRDSTEARTMLESNSSRKRSEVSESIDFRKISVTDLLQLVPQGNESAAGGSSQRSVKLDESESRRLCSTGDLSPRKGGAGGS